MLLDSHIHSLYSFDGSESIDKLCETAVSRKIDIITISDHTEVMEDSVFDDAAKAGSTIFQRILKPRGKIREQPDNTVRL